MTIITHNAPREGAASLRDDISHKYAKRLLSLLHAISQTCFVSVPGCSSCILKSSYILYQMRLFSVAHLASLEIGGSYTRMHKTKQSSSRRGDNMVEQFNIYPIIQPLMSR